jgi:hypothetical protein
MLKIGLGRKFLYPFSSVPDTNVYSQGENNKKDVENDL